jgi:hypothetical protein
MFKKYLILTIFLVFFLFLRFPSLYEPYWYGDEGIYLVLGQSIRHGVTLYRQIHDNKPPTLYYLAAFSQTVFGFRLLLSLWMIPAIYFFYLLAKKLLPPVLSIISSFLFLILTSIPLFEGNIANAEIFMLLPTLAGVYFFLYSKSRYKLLISGLLLGFAFTIKISVAVEFVFLFLWYLFLTKTSLHSKINNLIFYSIAFFLPFILYLLYFTYQGAIKEFLFASVLQNFGYLSSWSSGSHSGSATSGGLINRAIILFAFWLVMYFFTVKKYITQNLGFLCFWFSACLFGILLSTRPYPHYLIQVIPPLTILMVYLFDRKNTFVSRFLILLLFSVLAFSFVKYQFYVYPVFSYYKNFYTHISNLNSPEYRNYFGTNVEKSYNIASYVSSNTVDTDKIFVWGDDPVIYALSHRLPASKYTVAYHIIDFGQHQFVYDQLLLRPPKLIIYYPQPSRPYPQLTSLINRYYQPMKTFGDTIIFERLY